MGTDVRPPRGRACRKRPRVSHLDPSRKRVRPSRNRATQPLADRNDRRAGRFPPRARLGRLRDLPRSACEPTASKSGGGWQPDRSIERQASTLTLCLSGCTRCPQIPHSPFYVSMVTAWSLAEIIRYTHYATGLQGFKLKPLEWIRCVLGLHPFRGSCSFSNQRR